jgi:hypothetical protein
MNKNLAENLLLDFRLLSFSLRSCGGRRRRTRRRRRKKGHIPITKTLSVLASTILLLIIYYAISF